MLLSEIELYPLSKSKKITGSRRLVREKVLQILVAFEVSGSDLDFLFTNIFYRDYTFEPANPPQGVLLKPEQIIELGEKYGTTIVVWADNKMFVKEINEKVLDYKKISNVEPTVIDDLREAVKAGATKILWYDEIDKINKYRTICFNSFL